MCPARHLLALAASLAMVLASAGSALAGGPYLITGGDTGVRNQHVSVWDSAYEPVADATVTINGIEIPFLSGSRYSQSLPEALEAGDTFDLVVEIGTDIITCTDVVPPKPVITAPIDGDSIDQGTSLVVEWTSETDLDRFQVSAYPCDTNCRVTVDGDARSAVLDTSAFSTTDPVDIRVYALPRRYVHRSGRSFLESQPPAFRRRAGDHGGCGHVDVAVVMVVAEGFVPIGGTGPARGPMSGFVDMLRL